MGKSKKTWVTSFVILVFLCGLHAFSDEKTEKIDKIFERFDSTHTPGVSVAIIKEGSIIYKKAYGMASLELGVPNTTQTVFRLGSVSKQFTAACIGMLVQEGKLRLNDPITKFFPELSQEVYGSVEVRHMIHHMSGIRDSEALYPVMNIEYSQWYTHDMLLDMLARQKSLDFTPGERIEYSNSAYTLLALIVERVSEKSFHEFAEERIFDPLGMENTHIQTSYDTFIPNRAAGYEPSSKGYGNWMTNNQLVGHDAVYSSVEDMYHWVQAFFNKTLGKGLMAMMTEPSKFNDGTTNNYACGIVVDHYKGLKTYAHSGWYVGYLAFLIIFPEQEFSVVCLSNVVEGSPARACLDIAEIYLEEEIKTSLNELSKKRRVLDKALFDKLVGDYVGIDWGGSLPLVVEDEKLKIKGAPWSFEVSPFGINEFINYDRRLKLRVVSGLDGEDDVMIDLLSSMGSQGRFKKTKKVSLGEEELQRYAGEYRSEEIEANAEITILEGKILIQVGRLSGKLTPFGKNDFDAGWGLVKFERDDSGEVKSFGLSRYGFQNVLFERIN